MIRLQPLFHDLGITLFIIAGALFVLWCLRLWGVPTLADDDVSGFSDAELEEMIALGMTPRPESEGLAVEQDAEEPFHGGIK
jgi:hypothetical protein